MFALGFPTATVELSLANSVTVTTFNGDTEAESISKSINDLNLLGLVGLGDRFAFVGVKTTEPYTRATIALSNGLGVNVGEAMHVYDFCSGGRMQ